MPTMCALLGCSVVQCGAHDAHASGFPTPQRGVRSRMTCRRGPRLNPGTCATAWWIAAGHTKPAKSPSNAPASPFHRGIVEVEAPFLDLRSPFVDLRLPRIAIEAPFFALEGRFFALRVRLFDLERRTNCGNVGTRAPWVRLPRSRRVGRAHRRNVGLLRGRARAALATARASLRSPPECSGASYLVSPFAFLRGVESTSASGSIALASLPSFFARTLATP